MLQQLSEEVRACHERAAEARRNAQAAKDPALKAEFLDIEGHWLALARSYASTDKLGKFAVADSSESRSDEKVLLNARPDDALRLQEISTFLIPEGKLDCLYDRIIDAAMGLMSADMGSMQILDPERNELRLLAWRGFHPQSAAFWEWVRLDSACTCRLALSAGCRVVVPDVEASDLMLDTADLDAYRQSDIRAVQSTPLVSRSGKLVGMISTHWRKPHQPTDSELLPLDVLARQAADLIERHNVETALRESEERFRWLASIVEFSDDAIVSKNLDGIITSWNQGAERVFGYMAEEAIGKPITMLIPADRQDEERVILERIRRGDRIDHYETIRQRKDGSLIVISLTVSPVKNAEGKIVGASKIARDITERKRSETQISVLAREAEHRARNVLANVLAMVHLSQSDTPEGLKEAIEGRIRALANVHSLFVQSRWAGAELASLVRQELSPYSRDGETRTRIKGPTVMLEPDLAQALAVALHELATNAAKYGALSVAEGQVRVEWSQAADRRLVLRWIEAGGPPVNPPTRKGFGTRVMETMIRGRMRGSVRLDWHAEGAACEIAVEA
jgi:PAS domain S-box-containing protein